MSWMRFFHRSTWDTERARELESYLEIETDANVARGMPPDQARAAARRKLGNTARIREEIYEMNTLGFVETAWQDLKYGLRVLRLNPGFAAVAILSLTLGIGANTAIFQLFDALRLRALPVRAPDELVEVRVAPPPHGRTGRFTGRRPSLTFALYEQIRDHQKAFSGVLAWGSTRFNLSPGGEVRYAEGLWVSGSFFDVLGVRPLRGRLLEAADDQPACGPQLPAVLSYRFWQREHGADESVIGRTITLDGRHFDVVGITAPGFFGVDVGHAFDVAVPLCAESLLNPERSAVKAADHWWLAAMGRLRPGWDEDAATRHLQNLSPGIFEATLPGSYIAADAKDYRAFRLMAAAAGTGVSGLRSRYSTPLWLLLAIAGLVLLIACANLANLLLARATAREQEIAVRLAIGASRWRVTRQLITESLLLAAAGAALGLALAQPVSRSLVVFLSTSDAPLFLDLQPDWRIIAFTAGVATLACVLFGVAPAIRATRARSGAALQVGGRGAGATRERFGLRRSLVVVQVASSVVLVVGALLFASTLRNLATLDAGLREDGVLMVESDFSTRGVPPARRGLVARELLERLRALPLATSVAQTFASPLAGNFWNERVLVGPSRDGKGLANVNCVSEDYFRTMGINVLAGRDFGPGDTVNSPAVAVVTESFARRILGTSSPLGRTFRFDVGPGQPDTEYQVVGLVNDTKYSDLREEFEPLVYVAQSQVREARSDAVFAVRSDAPVAVLAPAIKQAIAEIDPGILVDFRTMRSIVQESLLSERLMAALSGFFGALAAVLVLVGLYGLTSYSVARRQKEIGIRMTLGADQQSVVALVLRECVRLLAIGLPVGVALALLAMRTATSLLFGIPAGAPGLVALAVAILAAVGVAASYIPARRASRLKPVDALRSE